MEYKYYHKKEELKTAVGLARRNKLYSPYQGLLGNYIDFLKLLNREEKTNLHLNMVLCFDDNIPIGVMVLFRIGDGRTNLWSFVHEDNRCNGIATSMFQELQKNRVANNFSTGPYSYGSPYLRDLLIKMEMFQ